MESNFIQTTESKEVRDSDTPFEKSSEVLRIEPQQT
jgi:hypothetical protein